MAVEVKSTPRSFFEQQDLFVIYQSLINAVCLIKSNSEERGVRKKGRVKQTTDYGFETVPDLLCLVYLKKDDQRTERATSFESCQASALWWVPFVQLKQQPVLCAVWTLIIAHLSNLLLWKLPGWRSTCKVVTVEADMCSTLWWVSCQFLFSNAVNPLSRTKLVINLVPFLCTLTCPQEVLKEAFYSQWLQEPRNLWLRDDKWM